MNLPFLATAQQGLNEPRYPSLPGIMKAKKKPLERLSVEDLELADVDDTAYRNLCSVINIYHRKKQAGKVLEGEMQSTGSRTISVASHEAKVI